jgi:copper homeostasis protein
MARDLELCRELGADAVVFGVLDAEGKLAVSALQGFISALGSMQATFHRAFDMLEDQHAALAALAELGVSRVLSSGGQASALEGAANLAGLVRCSADASPAPVLVAAAGIDRDNVSALVKETGVREVHVGSACRRQVDSRMKHRNREVHMGPDAHSDEYVISETDAKLVRGFVEALS